LELIALDPTADGIPQDVYTISRAAWKRLHAHPELIGLERDKIVP
jgi:hypothetical protein